MSTWTEDAQVVGKTFFGAPVRVFLEETSLK